MYETTLSPFTTTLRDGFYPVPTPSPLTQLFDLIKEISIDILPILFAVTLIFAIYLFYKLAKFIISAQNTLKNIDEVLVEAKPAIKSIDRLASSSADMVEKVDSSMTNSLSSLMSIINLFKK